MVMKGLAYPLVICRETPKSMENMKKIAIFLSLKRLKAFNPNISYRLCFSLDLFIGQLGSVKEYKNEIKPKIADTKN